MDALTVHCLHFAFTVTFHYLFPQLTMGLALLILVLKTIALRTGVARCSEPPEKARSAPDPGAEFRGSP